MSHERDLVDFSIPDVGDHVVTLTVINIHGEKSEKKETLKIVSTPATAFVDVWFSYCRIRIGRVSALSFHPGAWFPTIRQHLTIFRFTSQVCQSRHDVTQVFELVVPMPVSTAQ